MYRCLNCGGEFIAPLHRVETHGFSYPPYEQIEVCPYCKIADVSEIDEENEEDNE